MMHAVAVASDGPPKQLFDSQPKKSKKQKKSKALKWKMTTAWGKFVRSGGSEADPAILVPPELVFGSYDVEHEDIFFGRISPSANDLASRGFTHTHQVVISVPYASATHFKITRSIMGEAVSFVLTDLSRNGTIVNGNVVSNNHPVTLVAGDRVGLKFKTDTKVEYTFHALLAPSNAFVEKANPTSSNRSNTLPGTAALPLPQPDLVLLEQLQKSEHTCRVMTEEHAALSAQIGTLESQLAEMTAGRASEKAAAAADRSRMIDDHRMQMLDANSSIAANAARCSDLETKLETAQRAATEQAVKAKTAAAQVVKLQEQLQDQATTLQGTRESYMDGQARNTSMTYVNLALQGTLDAREQEWASNAAAVMQSVHTHESKLRGTLHAILSLGPALSSILSQLEQAGAAGVGSLDQLAAGVLSGINSSSSSSSSSGSEVKPKLNSQQRASPAETYTQASEVIATDENLGNMEVEAGDSQNQARGLQLPNILLKLQTGADAENASVGDKRGCGSQPYQPSPKSQKNSRSHSQREDHPHVGSQPEAEAVGSQSPVRLHSQPQERSSSSPSASDSSQKSRSSNCKRVRSQD